MSIKLPLYAQQKRNTCALACLRMVLAAFGTHVEERTLERRTIMQPEGILITELERLARHFNVVAEVREMTVKELRKILRRGSLPIAFIDRRVFDLSPLQRRRHSIRDAIIHTVIPIRVTAKSVTFHDPLPPRVTRKSRRLFRSAFMKLGGHCVMCTKSGSG